MAIGPLYRSFLEIARERGVDVDRKLGELGLTEAMLLDPKTRLSPEQGRAFGGRILRAVDLPSIGLEAAQRFRFGDFELLGYLMKHAADGWGMLSAAEQYGRLLGDTAFFRVERQKDSGLVSVGRSGGRKLLHEGSDFAAGVIVRCLRELLGAQIDPREVRLPREAPVDERPYRRFFRCPVSFGADLVTLVFPAAALSLPCRSADPQLTRILSEHAAEELARLPVDAPLPARVRAHLASHLERGEHDIAEVARQLSMSERTLRRRLREAGTGYRELVDDVRRERALMIADQGQHGATEMALMVGFEDGAAFARAFRRWTGMLPRDYLLARKRAPNTPRASEVEAPALRLVRPLR